MAHVHHFTYGAFNPIAAYVLAFLGSFLGLLSAARARDARSRGRRTRWLLIAAFSIGGGGIWLMHFTAMLGFDVPASPVRYDPWLSTLSLGLAVATTAAGLMVVGHGRPTHTKIVIGGLVTGLGVAAMHYTNMAAIHLSGQLHYRPALVMASGLIAVTAATLALWFSVAVRGWGPTAGAVCGTHYTGMAAVWVELRPVPPGGVSGLKPLFMIVPITLITAATVIGVALSALQAMTEEVFTGGAGTPRRGVHAEHPWSLRDASMSAMRRGPDTRPSPRPVPRRRPSRQMPDAARPDLQPASGA
jgi:NO-binding membrane sensor protein with MHYT domain